MSHHVAQKCFGENIAFVNPPAGTLDKRLASNLNQGLRNMSDGMQSDIASIETRLARIENPLIEPTQRR